MVQSKTSKPAWARHQWAVRLSAIVAGVVCLGHPAIVGRLGLDFGASAPTMQQASLGSTHGLAGLMRPLRAVQ